MWAAPSMCRDEAPNNPLQDTFKTSLCTNRLFPTARLSRVEVPGHSLLSSRSRMNSVLRGPTQVAATGSLAEPGQDFVVDGAGALSYLFQADIGPDQVDHTARLHQGLRQTGDV